MEDVGRFLVNFHHHLDPVSFASWTISWRTSRLNTAPKVGEDNTESTATLCLPAHNLQLTGEQVCIAQALHKLNVENHRITEIIISKKCKNQNYLRSGV